MRIVVDSREKQPIIFRDAIKLKLDTGDYSVAGLENILTIERKKSPAELAQNLVEPRFWRELERMAEFPHKYLLLEFSLEDLMAYPRGSKIPKRKWRWLRVRPKFMIKKLDEIAEEHGITIEFCGDRMRLRQRILEIGDELTKAS